MDIVDEFFSGGGPSFPGAYERLCAVIDRDRKALARIARRIVVDQYEVGACFEQLLSHLSESETTELLKTAAAVNSDASANLLEQMSLQFPHLLRPYFREIFGALTGDDHFSEALRPWRGADHAEIKSLLTIADSNLEPVRSLALSCLMETRTIATSCR